MKESSMARKKTVPDQDEIEKTPARSRTKATTSTKKSGTKSSSKSTAAKPKTRATKSATAAKSGGTKTAKKRTGAPKAANDEAASDGTQKDSHESRPRSRTSQQEKSAQLVAQGQRQPQQVQAAKQDQVWTEEVNVAGHQLVDKFKEIIAEGNALQFTIKQDNHVLLEVPLTTALAGGALAMWASPLLAALTAVAGAVAHVNVAIERPGSRPKGQK
jgi:hypothetical protein